MRDQGRWPMGGERAPRPSAGLARRVSRPGLVRVGRPGLVRAAICVALLGALAACGGSGAPASTGSAPSGTAGPSGAAAPSATAAASAGATAFAPIVEPFDPGHPARNGPAPATCGGQAT